MSRNKPKGAGECGLTTGGKPFSMKDAYPTPETPSPFLEKADTEKLKELLEFAKIERRRLLKEITRLETALDYWQKIAENKGD